MRSSLGDVAAAALVSAVFSGAPSTAIALVTGQSPLAAARAAGELLGRPGLPRGLLAHAVLSVGWSAALAVVLPRRHTALAGAAAGLGIAAIDLGIVGRRFPAIDALPKLPQLADHAAFGALVGATLAHRRA